MRLSELRDRRSSSLRFLALVPFLFLYHFLSFFFFTAESAVWTSTVKAPPLAPSTPPSLPVFQRGFILIPLEPVAWLMRGRCVCSHCKQDVWILLDDSRRAVASSSGGRGCGEQDSDFLLWMEEVSFLRGFCRWAPVSPVVFWRVMWEKWGVASAAVGGQSKAIDAAGAPFWPLHRRDALLRSASQCGTRRKNDETLCVFSQKQWLALRGCWLPCFTQVPASFEIYHSAIHTCLRVWIDIHIQVVQWEWNSFCYAIF